MRVKYSNELFISGETGLKYIHKPIENIYYNVSNSNKTFFVKNRNYRTLLGVFHIIEPLKSFVNV